MLVLNALLTFFLTIYVALFATFFFVAAGGAKTPWLSVPALCFFVAVYVWRIRQLWQKPSPYVRFFRDSFAYKLFSLLVVLGVLGFIVFLISPQLRQFIAGVFKYFGVEFDPG